jgi:hypothetical protein
MVTPARSSALGLPQETTMNPFQQSSLGIEVDEVLDPGAPLPHLFAGHSLAGERYLIIQTTGDEHAGTWVFAPITERALDCVMAGRAELRDVVAHTATGGVDIVTIGRDGRCTERSTMSQDLSDEDLPPAGRRLVCA